MAAPQLEPTSPRKSPSRRARKRAARAEIVETHDGNVTSSIVAERLGVDESTVRRNALAFGGTRDARGRWQFDIEQVVKRVRLRATQREDPHDAGSLAAECFERFGRGEAIIAIVQALGAKGLTPEKARDLWRAWIDLQQLQRASVVPRCMHENGECAGPIVPHVMYCEGHAARVRVLSPEQEATLRGQTIPEAVKCSACGALAGEGLCSSCTSNVEIVAERGGLVVRVGGRAVKNITRAHALELLGASVLSPDAPPATSAPVDSPPAAAARESAVECSGQREDGLCCPAHFLAKQRAGQ